MNRLACEQFINRLKVQQKLREAQIFYRVVVPRHCKTTDHPWGTFDKFLKWHVVDLYE